MIETPHTVAQSGYPQFSVTVSKAPLGNGDSVANVIHRRTNQKRQHSGATSSPSSGEDKSNAPDTDSGSDKDNSTVGDERSLETSHHKENERLMAKHGSKKSQVAKKADKERSKKVRLKGLSSISSGGVGGSGTAARKLGASGGRKGIGCYSCGSKAHKQKDCPIGKA